MIDKKIPLWTDKCCYCIYLYLFVVLVLLCEIKANLDSKIFNCQCNHNVSWILGACKQMMTHVYSLSLIGITLNKGGKCYLSFFNLLKKDLWLRIWRSKGIDYIPLRR